MKKIVVISMIVTMLFHHVYGFDETIIEDEEGLYIETIASIDVPNLNAKSAILYDNTYDRILYEKNAKEQRANASTTKMVTALVAYEYGNLNDVVIVSENAANTGGSSINLKTGDQITLDDLIKGLLIHSGNDASVAIAEHIAGNVNKFADLMNQKVEEIGAVDTHFVTPHGLDEEEHYSTAYDLMIIGKKLLENPYLANIVSQKEMKIKVNGNLRTIGSTNEMFLYYDGVNGIKTGYTGNAGRCLIASAFINGRQLISVVLGCDSKKNRTVDTIRLLDYGFQKYKAINLANWMNQDVFFYVKKSKGEIYRLTQNVSFYYPLKENEKEKITIEYKIRKDLTAPLDKGENIGKAFIKLDGIIIKQIDYAVPERINRKTWRDYFYQVIMASLRSFSSEMRFF